MADNIELTNLTRRGFLFTSAALTSCAMNPRLFKDEAQSPPLAQPVTPEAFPTDVIPQHAPVPQIISPSPSSPKRSPQQPSYTFTRVNVPSKTIALTFDDGPHASNTPRLLKILAARNVRATFYVIGNNVRLYPNILRETYHAGHEIGNHTQTHPLLSKLSNEKMFNELKRCEDTIHQTIGVKVRTMRPPYGGLLLKQRELVNKVMGYPTILWSVDPLDWKKPGPSVVASRIVTGTNNGGILLLHDVHSQTIDAVPSILDRLLAQGYQFVTVSELISMAQPIV